jgi:prepilin-type N-terminal cleavage/methylation domain-containing protein
MRRAPYRRPCRAARGVTVIEMMVVVVVAGVILALAVPSLRELLARQRVAAITAELVTDLQFARSEAVARSNDVAITFRDDDRPGQPTMTCYTVHTTGLTTGVCDCRKPLGTACLNSLGLPRAGLTEIKTTQVLRSTTVTLQPPVSPANQLTFSGTQGLAGWRGHFAVAVDGSDNPNYVADWVDFPVTIASSLGGKLRVLSNITGRPQVCSPDGSISGTPLCAE